MALPGLITNQYHRGEFVTDFREYATGSDPADWTDRLVPTTWTVTAIGELPGARAPLATGVAAQDVAKSWDRIGSSQTDGEILAIIYPTSTSSGAGVAMRGASPNAYTFQFNRDGANVRLVKSGVASLATGAFSYSANTAYYMRFQVRGTSIKGKIWAVGSAEPGGWTLSATDAAFASGWAGLVSYDTGNAYFGFFSFVPGSMTAPGISG